MPTLPPSFQLSIPLRGRRPRPEEPPRFADGGRQRRRHEIPFLLLSAWSNGTSDGIDLLSRNARSDATPRPLRPAEHVGQDVALSILPFASPLQIGASRDRTAGRILLNHPSAVALTAAAERRDRAWVEPPGRARPPFRPCEVIGHASRDIVARDRDAEDDASATITVDAAAVLGPYRTKGVVLQDGASRQPENVRCGAVCLRPGCCHSATCNKRPAQNRSDEPRLEYGS